VKLNFWAQRKTGDICPSWERQETAQKCAYHCQKEGNPQIMRSERIEEVWKKQETDRFPAVMTELYQANTLLSNQFAFLTMCNHSIN